MRKRLRKNGFSVIEVLIAIGVVATGILALMAVFITGTRSNQHGENVSRAVFYGRKLSEVIRANGLAYSLVPGVVPPPASTRINDNPGEFRPLDENTNPPSPHMASIRLPQLDVDGNPISDGMGGIKLDPADDKFERNIQMERASNTVGDYNYNLLRMKVTIRWVGGRTGDGLRQVQVDSLLKPASS